MTTPYRIETPRTVIRCYQPTDAPRLKAAVEASVDHLRPWMPWAHGEPTTLAAKVDLCRRFRGLFDTDQDYVYGIFTPDERTLLGGTGLHTRVGARAREIGYWIAAEQEGKGLVTEVVTALVQAAFAHEDLVRIEIRCDPRNVRSARIPERLGFVHEATLRDRVLEGELRDQMIWTLFRATYEASPLKDLPIRCFDACGDELR